MPISIPELDAAYHHCRSVTLKHARTFYFASVFLPEPKRKACYAVYAFCRYMDDLIDDNVARNNGKIESDTIRATITRWQRDLDDVYAGATGVSPIMIAWADVLQRYRIARTLPDELIEGVMRDLQTPVRYRTFDELYGYCYKVASVVGLMTSEIFGYDDPTALGHAIDLGVAMQLTNILRDVGEDYRNDRIYLPLEELREFGLDESDIRSGIVTDRFRAMMQWQIERAHRYYEQADPGILMLQSDSRLTVRLMSFNYRRILYAIERNDYNVFTRRASVSFGGKLASIPKLWWWDKRVRSS